MLGITIGSFAANVFVPYGRRKTIIVSNLVIVVATILTLILNFWTIIIGKFIFSVASGVILIATNVYLNETIPRHLNSLFGNVVNFGIITAIFLEESFGLLFPDINDNPKEAMDTQLWRVAYGFQIIPCVISTILWLTCHAYDSPQFIVDKGRVNDDAL